MGRNKELRQWREHQKSLWPLLPSGPFGSLKLRSLGFFTSASLRPVTGSVDKHSYPHVFLPSDRWQHFLAGESAESSNPLDPHEASFVVEKTVNPVTGKLKDKTKFMLPAPFMRTYRCQFCPATFSVGPEIDGEAFELRWKHWMHDHCTTLCKDSKHWNWEDRDLLPCQRHREHTHGEQNIYAAKPKSISNACKDFLHRELVKFPNLKTSTLRDAWKTFFKNLYPPPRLGPGLLETYFRRDDNPTCHDIGNIRSRVKAASRLHQHQEEAVAAFVARNPDSVPFQNEHVVFPCCEPSCQAIGTHSSHPNSTDVKCNSHAPNGKPTPSSTV